MTTETETIPATKVRECLAEMTGMQFGTVQLAYISSRRDQIVSAIRGNEPAVLAMYATQGVAMALRDAGYEGTFTPKTLRAFLEREGWEPIDAAISRRDGAMASLKRKIEAVQGCPARSVAPAPGPSTIDAPRPQSAAQRRMDRFSCPTPDSWGGPGRRVIGRPSAMPNHQVDPCAIPAPKRTDSAVVRTIGRPQAAAVVDYHAAAAERASNSHKVRGDLGAVKFEPDVTRGGQATVRMEATVAANPAGGWQTRIAIQLTQAEMMHVAALLLYGRIQAIKFGGHGPQQDKWFEVVRQAGGQAGTIRVTIGQGNVAGTVEIASGDVAQVAGLFQRQCCSQLRCAAEGLEPILRAVADTYNGSQLAHVARTVPRHAIRRRAG